MKREQSDCGAVSDAAGHADAEVELDVILASLTSILIQVNDDSTIRRWNRAAERALGYRADQVLGRSIADCGVQWNQEDMRRLVGHISLGESPQGLEVGFEGEEGSQRCLGVTLSPLKETASAGHGVLILARDITELMRTERVQRRLITAVEQVNETIVITDLQGTILYVNPAFERITGYTSEEVVGLRPDVVSSGQHDPEFYSKMWATLRRGDVWFGHFTNRKKDGSLYEEDATISPVRDEAGEITNYVAVKKDVTERLALEVQLRSAQKLESIGQLAAGIAHEINTPTQFISDNTRFLRDAFGKLDDLLKLCSELSANGGESADPEATLKQVAKFAQAAKIGFLSKEIPDALGESLSGLARVTEIVSAMKSFSHPGSCEKQAVDLNDVINTTITLSTNEWKYVAEIETDFDPELPLVRCLPSEMGQVVLNMIVNSAHAIVDAVGANGEERGRIRIATQRVGDCAEIRISDTGCGMPDEVRSRVFDPFYTTKEVGRGTGQGLAISHSVVVDKHSGSIDVESKPGEGTTFVIRLPFEELGTSSEDVSQAA